MHKYSPHKPKGVFHLLKDRFRFLLERFLLRGLGYLRAGETNAALKDFRAADTYPENHQVGRAQHAP